LPLLLQVYGLPFNGTRVFQRHIGKPLRAWTAAHISKPCARAFAPLRRCCQSCCPRCKQRSDPITTLGLPPAALAETVRPDGALHGSSNVDDQCYDGKLPVVASKSVDRLGDQQQQQGGGEGSSAGSLEHITVRMEVSNHGSKVA
jgi:hypothetical protein